MRMLPRLPFALAVLAALAATTACQRINIEPPSFAADFYANNGPQRNN
jgi:hypothetical protein